MKAIPTYTIQAVTVNDLKGLSEVASTSFEETYSWGNPKNEMDNYIEEKFSISHLQREFENPESNFYTVIINEQLVAYLKINTGKAQTDQLFKNALEIERIYILKAYQGYGIGRAFLDFTIQLAKQKNKTCIWLGVWEHNPKAIAFYERFGFINSGIHDFWFGGKQQTDFVMKLEL